jgi:hypothetical protein
LGWREERRHKTITVKNVSWNLGTMADTSNLSTLDTDLGRSYVPGKLGLHSKTLIQQRKKFKK